MNKSFYLATALVLLSSVGFAQDYQIKELKQTHIKGAPRLTHPQFLTTGDGALISVEKFGQAAPAVCDWDGDGKQDLLIGEFGSGKNANVVVYKNIGKNKNPNYSPEHFYAKDKQGEKLHIAGS